MKKFLFIAALFIPVLFVGVWIALPTDVIRALVEDAGDEQMVDVETDGFRKGLFYRFLIDRVLLKHDRETIVSLENVSLRINPLSLFLLSFRASLEGNVAGGAITGNGEIEQDSMKLDLHLEGARIRGIPFFDRNGIDGSGILSGRYTLINGKGHLEFQAKNAQLNPIVLMGKTIPLNFFHAVKGFADIQGDSAHAISVSFEGKHVYARMKGRVEEALADLFIEVMPDAQIATNPLFQHEFKKYEVSPGYFLIPVRGHLQTPA